MSVIQDQVDLRDAIEEARASGDDEQAAELALQYAWDQVRYWAGEVASWADPDRPLARRSLAQLRAAEAGLADAEETRQHAHARWLSCLRARWQKEADETEAQRRLF
jgi:hypothetical protein